MKEFLDKLSPYHFFNYLLPGVLFVILADKVANYNMYQTDIIFGLLLYYFIGLIISRVGSQVVEPLLKKIGFVSFSDYKDFVLASKEDPKLEILSEVNNMYRTLCTMFVILIIVKIYSLIEAAYPILTNWILYILSALLFVMFLFSYKKQSEFIVARVKADIRKGSESKKPL
jgi:hypothetical protein